MLLKGHEVLRGNVNSLLKGTSNFSQPTAGITNRGCTELVDCVGGLVRELKERTMVRASHIVN